MNGSFYRAFEDRYRGSRDLIKERLQVYRPFLDAVAGIAAATALDLGCGRGEWLELLGEAGFAARGVDLDEGMLAACRERGLDVVNGDAIVALRDAADGSLAVVSAFHLVEHIPFDQVQALIDEALRALRPGGLLILETPNPENLVVGTSSFYDDPSHLRPLPSKLLAFAVEFGGFARHGVLRLQEGLHLESPLQLFDVLAGVSPDYAIVAQKGGAPEAMEALDPQFARPHGIDLHTLAQRYQQQHDRMDAELVQLRAREESRAHAVQQQLAGVDAQITHLHSEVARLDSRMADSDAAQASLGAQIARLDPSHAGMTECLARIEAAQVGLGEQLACSEVGQTTLVAYITHFQTNLAKAEQRLDRLEMPVLSQAETVTARLRLRVAAAEQAQQASESEHARLAAHVAWLEGRLGHTEAQAAELRHQLLDLQRSQGSFGARVLRALRRVRQPLARAVQRHPRRIASALTRRLIQATLRRPAFKRVARAIVMRVPGLHARLLRTMYAQAPASDIVPVEIDPLAAHLSPRSLAIYRFLSAPTKHED